MESTYCPFVRLYGSWINLQHIARVEIEENSRLMVMVHWSCGKTHLYKDDEAEKIINALDRISKNPHYYLDDENESPDHFDDELPPMEMNNDT